MHKLLSDFMAIKKKPKKAHAKKPKIRKVKKVALAKPKKTKSVRAPAEKMNDVWVAKLLRDPRVRRWLVQAIGENSIHVIQEFDREMPDEEIAKKSNIRPSDVRVVLNRLHSYGLATYSRSRDKNSGWYSYVWRLDKAHAQELAEGMEKIDLGAGEQKGEVEIKEYYYCPDEGIRVRYLFEVAAANNFRCANCGAMLKFLEK